MAHNTRGYIEPKGPFGTCGHCGEPIEHEEDLSECAVPGCACHGYGKAVCVGCVRECAKCGDAFCPEHVATEAMDAERFAKHHCAACSAQQAAA